MFHISPYLNLRNLSYLRNRRFLKNLFLRNKFEKKYLWYEQRFMCYLFIGCFGRQFKLQCGHFPDEASFRSPVISMVDSSLLDMLYFLPWLAFHIVS